ncbi:MAG: hypothetical protein ABGZ53_34050, partial [Fuerstiella sp.]
MVIASGDSTAGEKQELDWDRLLSNSSESHEGDAAPQRPATDITGAETAAPDKSEFDWENAISESSELRDNDTARQRQHAGPSASKVVNATWSPAAQVRVREIRAVQNTEPP